MTTKLFESNWKEIASALKNGEDFPAIDKSRGMREIVLGPTFAPGRAYTDEERADIMARFRIWRLYGLIEQAGGSVAIDEKQVRAGLHAFGDPEVFQHQNRSPPLQDFALDNVEEAIMIWKIVEAVRQGIHFTDLSCPVS